MTVRVEVVTPCEHGWETSHNACDQSPCPHPATPHRCPGGSRRSFTGWPPEAIEAAAIALGIELNHPVKLTDPPEAAPNTRRIAEKVLAAAWGHITGDNK